MLSNQISPERKSELIKKLLANRIGCAELEYLGKGVNANDLSYIIQHIYDLNGKALSKVSMLDSALRKLDELKNDRRNVAFIKKIEKGFRDRLQFPQRKVILAEGDSWFNYPILLTDIIDRICVDPDMAVYSIAKGGDWLLNMLNAQEYVEELSILHPDVFLISGGGNDLVGSSRLAAIVTPKKDSREFEHCEWAKKIMERADKKHVPLCENAFDAGTGFLSKDFFALLMFFYLQYSFLIGGILHGSERGAGKFPGIKIITQGYDYARPSYDHGFGLNVAKWYIPLIRFLGHGTWLKTPLQIRGINDKTDQQHILYTMIYLFNEMMIEIGRIFNNDATSVYHIDSRGSVGKDGWTDELHPQPNHFMKTGEAFLACIKEKSLPTYANVYVVKELTKN